MKKGLRLSFLSIIIIALQANVIFAQVPNYIPSNGLVGYWPFSGNANDVSGNGNNGTVNGSTLTADRFGNANSAYSFDGVNDFIQTPNQSLAGSVTFSCWYKMSSFNTPGNDMFYMSNQSVSSTIYSSNIAFGFRSYQGEYGHSAYISAPLTGYYATNNLPVVNVWHNFTCVFENGNYVKSYLDNVLVYSNNSVITNTALTSLPVLFGGTGTSNLFYFLGQLDDIGIWNRALTSAEISGIYNTTPIGPSLSIAASPSFPACAGSPVILTANTTSVGATYSWFPGGATTPSITVSPTTNTIYSCTITANNISTTSSYTVNVISPPSITASNTSICAGLSTTLSVNSSIPSTSNCIGNLGTPNPWPNPSPANGGYLSLGSFGPQSTFSISMWVNPSQIQNGVSIILDASHGGGTNWVIQTLNSGLTWTWGTGEFNLTANSWQHLLLTYNNGSRKIFVNGIQILSWNQSIAYSGSPSLYLGNWPEGGRRFNGLIDELYITTDILQISNFTPESIVQTPSPLTFGLWHFDEGFGTSTLNSNNSSYLLNNWFWGTRSISNGGIISWSPGGATTPSITVSPTSTTTYTCTVTNANGACSSTQTITVNALPNVNAGIDQNVCASTITTLTATGASTYSWSGGIQNGIPFIPTATTTFTVTGTNAAGCTATDQVLVTVNPIPTIAPISGSNTVCEGATLNLSNTTVGGTWSSSNTNIATVNSSGVVSGVLAGSVNITYTFTDVNGCSNSAVKSITVNPTPNATITVTGSLNICPGQTVTLCAPSGTGYSYLWCNATITSCITTSFAGTYCLIVTNSFGCSSSNNQIIVNVLPTPTSNAGPDVTKNCIQNSTGAVIGAAAVAGNTYSWSPTTGLSSSTVANPTANPLFTTTYTVTTTNAVGCTSTDQVIVTVNTFQPTANAGLDFTKTCISNVNGLAIGAGSVTGNTYAWTPATGLSSATVSNPTANPSTTTTYTLTATNISSGCTATDQVLVTVDNQGPTVDAGIDISKTCVSNVNGATIGMTPISGNTYTWTPASGLSSTSIANPFANPTTTTTYTVSSTNPTTGCTSTDQIVVTVNNIPPTANAGLDATVSCNTNVGGAILGTPTVAGNTYSWTPSAGLNSSTLSQPTANPSTNTTYNLMVMNASSGCMSTDQVLVTVNTTPATANAGLDGSVNCLNSGTGFSIGSTPVAGMTYAWTPSTGLSSATVANPTASPTVATVYTLTATNAASGCTATDQVTVFINIQVPSVDAGLNQIICAGTPVTLTGNGSAGATFQWDNGIQNGVTFVPTTTTTYTLTATASNGCSSTDQVIVAVNSLPSVSAGPDVNACDGSAVTLSGSGALTYTWQPAVQNGQAFIPVNSSAFIVTGTDANNCHSTDTVQVNVVQSTVSTLNESACDSYTLNGQSYTQSGTYIQVINNTSGCDSTITITLNLEFSPITPVITLTNGVTMTTPAQANVTLQWINCSDLTPIAGATGTTFTASVNGVYAVVASNVCGSDTSECSTVNSVGLETLSSNGVSVFPNPTNELLTVQVPVAFLGSEWNLVDIRGRQVLNGQVDIEQFQLNLSDLARGTYWLSLGTNQPIQVVKN